MLLLLARIIGTAVVVVSLCLLGIVAIVAVMGDE